MTPEAEQTVISSTREELRQLATSIIDAYEMRVTAISAMMRQAYGLVQSYQRDMDDTLSALRDNMAKGQSLRRCDFDRITGDVISTRARRERQVLEHLDAFGAEEEEMIARLRQIVAHGKASDLSDLRNIQEEILTRQRKREQQMIGVLRSFEIEQHELRTALKWLLDKGGQAKVAHLRKVVNALTTRWMPRQQEMFEMVRQLEDVHSRVRTHWRRVMDASTGTASRV